MAGWLLCAAVDWDVRKALETCRQSVWVGCGIVLVGGWVGCTGQA